MTDTRELVERLRKWNGCWPAPGLDRDVERSADALATLSERNRRLTAVAEEIASRQTLSGHDGDLDWLIDDARAALTSGGRG